MFPRIKGSRRSPAHPHEAETMPKTKTDLGRKAESIRNVSVENRFQSDVQVRKDIEDKLPKWLIILVEAYKRSEQR